MEPKHLPTKEQRNKLKLEWHPIFKLMEEAPDVVIPSNPGDISAELVNESFARATEYTKQRASYIWNISKSKPANWSLGEWSKHTLRSAIETHGMSSDKALLHEPAE
jgi:hypothetical protein